MNRKFVESDLFKNRVDRELSKDFLKRIQEEILKNPEKGDLIPGTGGIRKIRIGSDSKGKSGSYRVFYLDLPDVSITHLMFLLLKNERANITSSEKKILKDLTGVIKQEARSKKNIQRS